MKKYCTDCGCRLCNGVCSNCQEELYILENQNEWIDCPVSDEFIEKARDQKRIVKRRKER